TEAAIDNIMQQFMGIDRYIKMDNLPYDVIHHIDMHMKLLDEETILMGEYPQGVSDGPQIEANLLYILNNFMSPFGTPYKIVRIPMPPNLAGQYPNNGSNYYTHANSVIVNKTILVPIYNLPSDTTALRIFREAKPGYKVVGINSNPSIPSLGAIHCITKEIGTGDPLLIIHNDLEDTYDDLNPYPVDAIIKHRSGIAGANLMYTTDTLLPYLSVAMTLTNATTDTWSANIPAQAVGSKIFYYIDANANSGKSQVRPLPAPAGYWDFDVLQLTAINDNNSSTDLAWGKEVFPNPSNGITCITTQSNKNLKASLQLTDLNGRLVEVIFDGEIQAGEDRHFINTSEINAGVYLVVLNTKEGKLIQKLLIQ
ncbi:MAG: T9SS type A sorting domain-containing protein, partial [Bacteroidia bacterium]|nr:T9SS type A sorting domain-containing protein [Bacteroidia bacterium]